MKQCATRSHPAVGTSNEAMKQFLIIISFTLLAINFSLAQVFPTWISKGHFPDANSSSTTAVSIDPSGNILLAGTIYDNDFPFENIFVMKLDNNGELQWLQSYNSEDTLSDAPNMICIDDQGNVYITFMKHTLGGTYWSIAVQKYSASNGLLQWTTELPEAQFNGFEWQVRPKFMTNDGDHLYVAGTKFEQGVGNREMLAMKLDFDGNILWTSTHAGSGDSNSKSITVDENGNVYIAGDAWNASID